MFTVSSRYRRAAKLGRLGQWEAVLASFVQGAAGGQSQNSQGDLFETFKIWIQQGQLKVAATAKAENFVRQMYGLANGCALPQPGLPIAPGGKLFCDQSVAGMIERCQLDAAERQLDFLSAQMQALAARDPYFARWQNEYGSPAISNLNQKIAQARSQCGLSSLLPTWWGSSSVWTPPATPPPGTPPGSTPPSWSGYPGPNQSSTFDPTMISLVAGVVVLAMVLFASKGGRGGKK